jgi:predicted transcriptional regulator
LEASNNTYSENFSGEWRIKNWVAGNAITVNGVEYNQIAIDGKLMTIDSSKNVTVLE